MWSNFHTHSNFCDGKGELSDYCLEGEKSSLASIGFSSHAPLPFPCLWCMKPDDLPRYLNAIDELRKTHPKISIYKGLEVDFIPGVISPRDFSGLDYTIGSIHFVDKFPDGRRWEIDGSNDFFEEGLRLIFENEIKSAVTRYFELTRQMIIMASPTIIGHLDKIKIQNAHQDYFSESDTWYQTEIRKTLEVAADAKIIIEVNTRGIYQRKSPTTYPSPWILQVIRELEIPVTISSDAHHPKDLTKQFSETAAMLRSLGFERVSTIVNGEWQSLRFDETGIQR